MIIHHAFLCFAVIAFNLSTVQSGASGSRPALENDQSNGSSYAAEECSHSESTVQSTPNRLDEVVASNGFLGNVDDAQQDTLYPARDPHLPWTHSDSQTPSCDADNRTTEPRSTVHGIDIEVSVGLDEWAAEPLPALDSNHSERNESLNLNHAEDETQASTNASLTTAVTTASNSPPPAVNVSGHLEGPACNRTQQLQGEHFTFENGGEKAGEGSNYQGSWSGGWAKAPTAISTVGAMGTILVLSSDRKRKQRDPTSEGSGEGDKSETAEPQEDTDVGVDCKRAKLENQTLQEGVDQDQAHQGRLTSQDQAPQCRPISQDQLVAEVKGIYAGLVMIEAKCIEVDNAQKTSDQKLNKEQWQALIGLHRTLLHEHHDFFLVCQHPAAGPRFRRLATKYAMPARLWRHGIHSFLEVLRHRLPHSLEHMLTFLYMAYSMMALLCETVPAFEETWIECLADLGRYRAAIEDDIEDREARVSQCWPSRASYDAPSTARLYHDLAILCRENPIKQLLYLTKSLCTPIPFLSARQSIMTLPMFDGIGTHLSTLDATFLQAHAILFAQRDYEKFDGVMESFLRCLEDDQGQLEAGTFLTSRYPLAIITCNSLLGYGNEKRVLLRPDIEPDSGCDTEETIDNGDDEIDTAQQKQLTHACTLAGRIDNVLMLRAGDPDILEYLHVRLVFMLQVSRDPFAMNHLEKCFPWDLAALCLNAVAVSIPPAEITQTHSFPRPNDEADQALPEDWEMGGLFWTKNHFPEDWFANEVDYRTVIDGDEQPTPAMYRKQRVLFVGRCLAESPVPLLFNPKMNWFYSTLEDQADESIPTLWQATSPEIAQSQDVHAWQNTTVEVHMASANRVDDTEVGLDAEESPTLSLAQITQMTQPEGGISQSIVEQSDVASIGPRSSSDGTSTGMTEETLLEAPEEALGYMVTSEDTKVTSTHQAEVNIIDAAISKSQWPKTNALAPAADPEYPKGQEQIDCITVIPRKAEDDMNSKGKDLFPSPIPEAQQAKQPARGPIQPPSASCDISITNQAPYVKNLTEAGKLPRFPCAHCPCVYARACDLNKHASKHTKPVKCDIPGCPKTCSTSRDLKRHQVANHPEQFRRPKIPCDVPECGRFFTRKDNMVRHKKKDHPS